MTPSSPYQKAALHGAALLLAVGIALAFLKLPIPTAVSLHARNGYALPLLFTILFAFFFRLQGLRGSFLSLASVLVLFALPLSALWHTGLSNDFVIGGLLPFSDAAGYYNDALRLLNGNLLSEFSTRRPLFPGLLSVLLWLAKGNLQAALAVLVFLTAGAVYLAARTVRNSTGPAAATLFVLICFLFYRRSIGTTMTEHLGMALGALGFALFWAGAAERKMLSTAGGLALLTLALCARAGAFFTLPLLLLWMAFYYRGGTRYFFRILLIGSASIAAVFALHAGLTFLIGNPRGAAFSNFAYTLYGLVFGGNWQSAINNPPPEIAGLTGRALTDKLYEISLHAVFGNPFLLFSGFIRAWKEFILRGMAFSFIIGEPDVFGIRSLYLSRQTPWMSEVFRYAGALTLIAGLHILAAAGVFRAWVGRRGQEGLLLFFLAGLFLSLPFAPPWDSQNGRIYAATIPFFAILPSCGLAAFLTAAEARYSAVHQWNAGTGDKAPFKLLFVFSALLVCFCLVGPVFVHLTADARQREAPVGCPPGTESLSLDVENDSFLTITNDDGRTILPRVRKADFSGNNRYLRSLYPEVADAFDSVGPGESLILNDKGYVVLDSLPPADNLPAVIHLCGEKKHVGVVDIFRAEKNNRIAAADLQGRNICVNKADHK